MINDINSLLELQKIDRQILAIEKQIIEIPVLIEETTKEFNTIKDNIELSKKNLIDNQLERKNLELDLKIIEDGIKKHQTELNNVKSNEAYKALVSEIADKHKKKDDVENLMLQNFDKADVINRELSEATEVFKAKEQEINNKISELKKSLDDITAQKVVLENSRSEFTEKISKNTLALYGKMKKRRGGRVVVSVDDGVCSGCNMPLPPQKLSDLMSSNEIVLCDICNCILYIAKENK